MTTLTRLGELTGEYVVDAERSRIGFVARHRVGTRVRGQFGMFEGGMHVDGDVPALSSAWLSIRAASIDTENGRRDAQLAKDFLGAAAYPRIGFVSTAVEQAGSTTFDVTGDLTIRGVTQVVTVPFELSGSGDGLAFTGRQTIDRQQWRANWNGVTTALVSPDVVLDLQITATRRR